VRQPRRLPEALAAEEVSAFLADLRTCRHPAIVLLMLLGGLRSAEVRSLRLADVDQGRRRVKVVGKGGKERVVPVDGAFFTELAAYLARERPPGLSTPECFVVLRGPTAGQVMTEAGLPKIFRSHRASSGEALDIQPVPDSATRRNGRPERLYVAVRFDCVQAPDGALRSVPPWWATHGRADPSVETFQQTPRRRPAGAPQTPCRHRADTAQTPAMYERQR
jgi:hypothetical protein